MLERFQSCIEQYQKLVKEVAQGRNSDDFIRRLRESDEAWKECEKARTEIERHLAEHKCQTV